MRVLRLAALIALANLASVPAAQAQPAAMNAMLQQATPQRVPFDEARFDSLTARQLGEIFDAAAAAGLPTDKLINRARQGAALRVNSARIITAVRMHAAALLEAREVLGTASTAAELDVGADALKAGIPASTLAQVRAARTGGSVEMPLVVLIDLVSSRQVPVSNAREAVLTLSRVPRSDEALSSLQQVVAKNSVRGPGMALDALNRYVKGTVSGSIQPSTPVTPDRKPIRPPPP
ncbi:MAG: hypothetical protein V4617_12715 [Gemmatimonadota bacterium]